MGSIGVSGGFDVIVKEEEVVYPRGGQQQQEHWLPMSNLDLLLPPLDVGVFFCYKKRSSNSMNIIKQTLAEALVSFYAFAGEVVENGLGEPEILCNNRGVDLVEAYGDVDLKDIDLHRPDVSVHGKLVPFKNHGVLSVQVTELRCGGIVIGCTFDHRVADAHSANMFFVAWAQIARSIDQSLIPSPSFRRSLLNPRRPFHYHKSIDDFYVLLSSLPPPEEPTDHLISRIYYVKAEAMEELQTQATSTAINRRSKLESFSAILWKIVAELGRQESKKCKLGIVVDGRGRLNKKNKTMQNYFGNVLSVPFVEASVRELKSMDLTRVAEIVHDCLREGTKEEHFLGLIDWVEFHRPQPAIVKVYCKEPEDEAAIVVSSGQRFPVSEIDFGWGKPHFGSYHFPWGGETGYVMPMPSSSRDGDWIVYMHLLERHLDFIEEKAAHIFRPITPTYLNIVAK